MRNRLKSLLLIFCNLVIFCAAGCNIAAPQPFSISSVKTYKDIPGITQQEINAIDDLRNSRKKLSYGQPLSAESFILPDGTYAGFTIKFCSFLSEFFGIEFAFERHEWDELIRRINEKTLDFTGELTPTPENMRTYHMTYPIAERSLRIFTADAHYGKILSEQDAHGLKIGFLEGTNHAEYAGKFYPGLNIDFTPVYSPAAAADMLQSGEIDAFMGDVSADFNFFRLGVPRSREFFPLVYMPVSLATANGELQPVISALNKYIEAGGIDVLHDLYRQGDREYARHKLEMSFTEDERAFLDNLKANGSTVKVGMETDNYPVSFYDTAKGKFEGITEDVLSEISKLTGIEFEIANSADTPWTELFNMLQAGEISLVSELLYTAEREGLFLWTEEPYASSYFAFISRYDYPDLLIYQVVRTKVGAVEGTANAYKYKEWFPANENPVFYQSAGDAFNALKNGEIDLIMGSDRMLLMRQNYYQDPGYKINIRFAAPVYSYFGLNKNEIFLCSIINKTMDYINTGIITNSWTSREYDYSAQIARQRTMYFFIITIVLAAMLVISLFFLQLIQRRRKIISKLLEKTKQVSDYELMKHILAIKALGTALWDMDIPAEQFKNEKFFSPDTVFTWSHEFRQLLGFKNEKDFPNVIQSWTGLLHPEDLEKTYDAIMAHLKDFSGKTPYDIEYRLKTKDGEYRYYHAFGMTQRDSSGFPLRFAGGIEDITDKKRMALELSYNSKLLSAVNSAAASLLNTDSDSFESALYQGMKVVAEAMDASRMYIWKNHTIDGVLCSSQIYEWSEGAEPQQGTKYAVNIPYSENIPGLKELLSSDQCLNGIVRNLPSGYQEQLVPQGIVSVIIVPVFMKNDFWGFVGLDDCRNERIFTKQEEAILRSGSLLFAHAYHRNEMLQNIHDTSVQLEKAMVEVNEANKIKQASISSLENILNSIDVYIYAAVPETGELLFVNDAIKKLYGRENDNLVGEYCYKVFRNRDDICDFCPCYKLNENPDQTIVWEEYEEILDHKLLRSDSYINWPNGEKVHLQHAVDITDITKRKESEEKAKAESEAKSRFLATMSHEIRTPMNVILGSTESLLENDSHTNETREVLEKINNSGNLLLHIINDILDLSKIEANKFEIIPQKYEVTSLINDTVNLNIIKYGQKDIKFILKVSEDLPLFLFGDEVRIKQIANNLLSNAFKYTESGEVSVSFFSENTTDKNTTLVIRVKDTGQGMTDEQMRSLFSEYTRFNLETNRTTEGTGLGLAITRNLAKLMNGKIEVESVLGKGSVFTARLPQEIAGDSLLGREAAENLENFRFSGVLLKKKAKIIKEPMPYGRVLIVDDMKSNIDVAVLLLKPYQLQIDTALSGYEAIDIIKSGKMYDIVFMDHMMPKMDGIETVRKMRNMGYTRTIIALTANAIVGQAEMFIENGFNGCITKPIDTRELNSALTEYIKNKHAQ